MPSNSRKSLDENLKDIERLLELHQMVAGSTPGRKYGLEVLNKSGIVLITAYWEAYCEDLASEALAHIVKHAETSDQIPVELRKSISRRLKKEDHELSVWKVADRKWKTYLTDRLSELAASRDRKLNTPKTDNINQLFLDAIGLPKISSSWRWDKKMTITRSTAKLDRFVGLRGEIAHRGKALKAVKKAEVLDFLEFVKKLSARTGGSVNSHVIKAVGTPLFTRERTKKGATKKGVT